MLPTKSSIAFYRKYVEEVKDGKVYIVGGGVSLKTLDLSPLQGEFVIAVNNAFFLHDWMSFCWFGDERWFLYNEEKFKGTIGLLSTCNLQFMSHPKISCFPRRKLQGIESEFPFVSWNRNSGGSAINVAYHFGAKQIYLVGFDMKVSSDGQNNFHNDHLARWSVEGYDPYPGFIKCFNKIAEDAKTLGIEIINTNPDSALECFKKVSFQSLFEGQKC